jgi:transcriptional regulator with XRE-family HTH domain
MKEDQPMQDKVAKLGQRIRSIRLSKGYTNAEKFAYEHNISRSQYAQYESGKDLRFSSLVKLTQAFGMTMEEFFSEGFDD